MQTVVSTTNISGAGLHQRRCRVQNADVVWLRSILEAYDGLAYLYGDGTGVVVITSTQARARELDMLLCDLQSEIAIELDQGF